MLKVHTHTHRPNVRSVLQLIFLFCLSLCFSLRLSVLLVVWKCLCNSVWCMHPSHRNTPPPPPSTTTTTITTTTASKHDETALNFSISLRIANAFSCYWGHFLSKCIQCKRGIDLIFIGSLFLFVADSPSLLFPFTFVFASASKSFRFELFLWPPFPTLSTSRPGTHKTRTRLPFSSIAFHHPNSTPKFNQPKNKIA